MARVKNSSAIQIVRTQVGGCSQALGNRLFNGYVYNLSLSIGSNGESSSLILNLALERPLTSAPTTSSISTQRRNARSIDTDFNIDESLIGSRVGYDISIKGPTGGCSYTFKNFKIISFSINTKSNEKILTLTLCDNSIILNKIYVGLLGQHVGLDERSEKLVGVDNIGIHCPQAGFGSAFQTSKNVKMMLHFPVRNLATSLSSASYRTTPSPNFNYITMQSNDSNIQNGAGAVILVGEEEFRDAPCAISEMSYTFKTLLQAMKQIGIVISSQDGQDSLKDKSQGRIVKNFSGTLKEVLNQWCDEYSYSYAVDFTAEKITIKGTDLSSPIPAAALLKTKSLLESLESVAGVEFVIESSDFDYDLAQKKLKLYSSYYFKEGRDKSNSFQKDLGNQHFYSVQLKSIFPSWFGVPPISFSSIATSQAVRDKWKSLDFCGAKRTYAQVITSAVLGKFSPQLRQIYNYQLKAFEALGFTFVNKDSMNSELRVTNDKELLLREALSAVMEIQSEQLFSELHEPMYLFHFGFYNSELVSEIERVESYIADFIGRHYWTDSMDFVEGVSASAGSYDAFEIKTLPATEKVLLEQIYKLPFFKEARFLSDKLVATAANKQDYFKAFKELNEAKENAKEACKTKFAAQFAPKGKTLKHTIFYAERAGAIYGVFEELIQELQTFKYSIELSGEIFEMNLVNLFVPIFKELSPSAIGLLMSVLPVKFTGEIQSYRFGILAAPKMISKFFTITPIDELQKIYTNAIELQNQIKDICLEIASTTTEATAALQNQSKNFCSKTILHQVCVASSIQQTVSISSTAGMMNAIGPSPYSCFQIAISRPIPDDAVILAHLNQAIKQGAAVTFDPKKDLAKIYVHTMLEGPRIMPKGTIPNRLPSSGFITLPAEGTYGIKLISQTDSESFIPYEQYVRGGLESQKDIAKIIKNDGFDVEISLNNLTPNIRETFGDASGPSFTSVTELGVITRDPVLINYQGHNGDSPAYQFNTFAKFHDYLKSEFDEKAISTLGPGMSYSANLFCATIPGSLKDVLSVNNGLVNLSITLGEGGLNIKCEFNSRPAKQSKMETLILKSKPNIKFQNSNYSV